jgi:hypothetical protein
VEDTKVISNLAIGEIRAGGAGFYVRTAITIADSAEAAADTDSVASSASATNGGSGTTVKNQLVYMEPSNETMKVISLKDI